MSSEMDPVVEEKLRTLLSIGEECINAGELRSLIESGQPIIGFDGFEPSGRMHIAQGILRAHNTNKITSSGGKFIFLCADFFALMNGKLDGDMEKIRTCGKLMIEIWKACGMKMENVEFKWTSEELAKRHDEFWPMVIDLATKFSITKLKGCTPILGREESDDLPFSTLLYAAMQAVDIPFFKVNVASLGLDQRKVLMLTDEFLAKLKRKHHPTFLMHHMLMGLDGSKMSKGNPDNAIFMDDSPAEVNRKIKKAFCPERIVEGNPIIDFIQHLIFPRQGFLEICRKVDHGGDVTFTTFSKLEEEFREGRIHPGDLKTAVAITLNKFLEPIHQHLENNPEAKALATKVRSFKITPKPPPTPKPKEPPRELPSQSRMPLILMGLVGIAVGWGLSLLT